MNPVAAFLVALIIIPFSTGSLQEDQQFEEFITTIEQLVLNTTDRALNVTRNDYLNLRKKMSAPLEQATRQMMQDYVTAVEEALNTHTNYSEKRKLFKQFRQNNREIDQLRVELEPQQGQFQFQLISDDFYNEGRNSTEFDNLYLAFMKEFDHSSQLLWNNMSERTVEEQEDLLEILDEIANEKQLREKDKLYDEFIEMYLFRDDVDCDQEDNIELI